MLTVWGRRNSYNVQKVMWLVGELGLTHEHIDAGGDAGGLDDPAFRAMNPHGKVPVLKDGETVVWESQAILRYLAAQYGGDQYWPADAGVRARTDQWMDWCQTVLQPDFLTGLFWGYYRMPEARRDAARIGQKVAACAAHMRQLDAALGGQDFLLGDRLGLADITAGTALFRYDGLDITDPLPAAVAAWYARLRQRPAYRDHIMLAYDDLYGRLEY